MFVLIRGSNWPNPPKKLPSKSQTFSRLRKAAVTKPLISDIFLSTFPFFSKLPLSVLYGYMWTKNSHHELFSLNYLLLYLVSCTLSFLQPFHWLHHFFQIHRKNFNLSTSKSFPFAFESFKPTRTLTTLLISSLST